MSSGYEGRRRDDDGDPAATGARVGKHTRVADRYPTLGAAMAQRGGGDGASIHDGPSIHDAATIAVERKDGGAPVDAGVAARVGAHLGADFAATRVHQDPLAQEATAAMGARAFAYGGDVFLGPGERGDDLGLMAHELTHVVQQGAAGQRLPQRQVQVGDAHSPAEAEADAVAAQVTGGGGGRPAALLVDDGAVTAGQMLKRQFLDQVRGQITAAAEQELGPAYAGVGLPTIDQQFARYAAQPAAAAEAMIRRTTPAAAGAHSASELVTALVARMRAALVTWRETGEAPADLPAATPAGAAGGAAQAQALRAPDGRDTLASLSAELGPGVPLDGATASRMSSALGVDVGAARIHTGAVAARKADAAGALAYAVGEHVVMAAQAPSAGTIEGDALLAHELAHVAQQAGAAADPVARRKPIGDEASGAEDHADDAAAAAVASLHGGKGLAARLASKVGGALSTGLQLQRCKSAAQRAHDKLVHLAALDQAHFQAEVGAATRADTETLLANISPADRVTYAALITRIKDERVIANAEQLQGHLYWAGPSGPDATGQINTTTQRGRDDLTGDETNTNDFAVWIRGGAEPTDASKMNCWEMVLYSAWRAGVVSKAWLVGIHTAAAAGGGANYHDVLAARMGFGAAAVWHPGDAIPRGQIVFMDGMDHVCISTGNLVGTKHEVMSLWQVPFAGNGNFNSVNQRTTVEDLAAISHPAEIRHGAAPW